MPLAACRNATLLASAPLTPKAGTRHALRTGAEGAGPVGVLGLYPVPVLGGRQRSGVAEAVDLQSVAIRAANAELLLVPRYRS